MMRKKLVSMLMAAMMCLSLTACGGGGGSSSSGDSGSSGSGGGSSSDPLQVVIWDNNQQAGIQEICDLFTEETGIKAKVEVKEWDSYWTLLEAGASGGELPDVFWMHSNNSQIYMNNDMLLNLDDYIANSDKIDMDNYMPEVTELYTLNDSIYAMPKDYDTIALWYNKKMFDEEKLDYPDNTWTWDDFYEAAKKLTHDGQYGFAMNTSNDQDSYYNMVYSMGGYILSDDQKTSGYDDPNTLKAMEYAGKLLADCCPNATTMAETQTDALVQSGTVAMVTQGSWMVAGFNANEYMTENCDVAILPYDKETGIRASICNGLGWAAPANSDRPDDCWALIEWFGSEEMQKKQAELGVTMSAFNGTSDTWVNCSEAFNLQPYLDIAEESTDEGVTNELILRPCTYNSTKWSQQAQLDLVPAWNDPSLMEETCKKFAATMNDLIAAENK